jgi:Uma2 family endonuclease
MLQTPSRVEIVERMTSEEFFRFAPDKQKSELVDGVIIVSPPPLDGHERLQIFLLHLIRAFVEEFDLGEVRGSRTAVSLDNDQVFEPDILFVTQDRLDIVQERGVFGPPDLVVEILSASTVAYDRGTKFQVYQQSGVQELWLIDPYGPTGTEFFQRDGRRLKPVMPQPDGVLASVALSGFKLNTAWLWPAEKFITVRNALRDMGVE